MNLFRFLMNLRQWLGNQDRLLTELGLKLDSVIRKLNSITTDEEHIMSAVDDLKAKLQALDDEADAITAGINAIAAAQAAGNQAAVDNAIADLTNSVDTVKQHVDAAQAALSTVAAPAAPSA